MSQRLTNDLVIKAALGQPTPTVPVWFMRQAGRSLPEYRAIRKKGSILDTIQDPQLSAEITVQPVRRYGVDAAILYSDIIVPVFAVGFGIEVAEGRGPVVNQPFRSEDDLQRLRHLEPETDTPYVLEAIKTVVNEIGVPLIGFAGAPFTVASYLIEGGPTKSYIKTKTLMRSDPALWHKLMDNLSRLAITSLRSQINAGASMYQLFDSWAGILSPAEYREMVAPHSNAIFQALKEDGLPSIHFGVGTANLLDQMANSGCTTLGIDDRTGLDDAFRITRDKVGLQGNLDPVNILIGQDVALAESEKVLLASASSIGYIFNLGHGVLPQSDPQILKAVVDLVHEKGAEIRKTRSRNN
ncbi:MAG: uroporphyrinogen decarboxylase [Acidimicrobiaceae bacterium]|nr:uroporphyrinogen decarboxylase [Acidimicrobiaceae bacterium]